MNTRYIQKAYKVLRNEGIHGLGARLLRHSRPSRRNDDFDLKHGVSTDGDIPLWKLAIDSRNWTDGVFYRPVAIDQFNRAMSHLPITPSDYVFIDLGCGKGRALILAAQHGFKCIIGVEFSHELCDIARANFKQVRPDMGALIACQDAREFVFPDAPAVVFMYDPFGAETMAFTIPKVKPDSYIVYVNPKHAKVIPFELMCSDEGLAVYHVSSPTPRIYAARRSAGRFASRVTRL